MLKIAFFQTNTVYPCSDFESGLYQPKGGIMRRYETTVIVDPDLSEEDRTALFDRVKEIIVQQQGILIEEDFWGTKKLAYEIRKKPRGYYARYDYCGLGPLVSELERFFRIDDRLMKYLTVLLDAEADVEKIQAEAAEAKKPQSEEPTASPSQTEATASTEKAESGAEAGKDQQETETKEQQPEEE
jgi:small subunit ribosomal protein S6